VAFILDDILLSPVKFTIWLGEKLRDAAVQEMTDETRLQDELLQLQMQFEMGEIDEQEFEKQEAELMERMEEARKLKSELTP
jgi:deoxyribodipyrimidine photolyase-like uncharacterized protein